MSFTPGNRVRWATKDTEGTVLDGHSEDWPDFVPVQWDSGDRTFSHPAHIQTVKSGDAPSKVIVTAIETNN